MMLLKLTLVSEHTDADGVITCDLIPYLLNPTRIHDAQTMSEKKHGSLWANEMRHGARTLFTIDGERGDTYDIAVTDDITDVAIRCGAV